MIDYRSVSLANQVFSVIEKNIINEVYAPGDVLSESRLSKELGVSRTPIREALGRLEAEKLIVSSTNGSVVLGITTQDVEDMFMVKRALEPEAFRRAARSMSEGALEKLKSNLEKQEFYAVKKDSEQLKNLDTEFHDLIYEGSGSMILFSILSPNHHKLLKFRKASLEMSDRIEHSYSEHVAIYHALAERNEDLAAALITEHVNNAYENINENIKREEK